MVQNLSNYVVTADDERIIKLSIAVVVVYTLCTVIKRRL